MTYFSNIRYMQYVSAFTGAFIMVSSGSHASWPSPSLPLLTAENSPIGITLSNEEASWVASVNALAAIVGALSAGVLAEKFGRKGTLIISSVPSILAWILIIFAKSVWWLISARCSAGFATGIALVCLPMYLGEIAETDIRGKLGTAQQLLNKSGYLLVLSAGPFISYLNLALSCSILPVVFLVLFSFVPESPYYLVKIGKKDAARTNVIRLSGKSDGSDVRLAEIERTIENDMKNPTTVKEIFSKQYRKAFLIMLGLISLLHCSGSLAIDAYTQTIIQLSGSGIAPEYGSIICAFIQIPAVLLSSFLVDKVGRKILLVVSALGSALGYIGLGIYFYLQDVVQANMDQLSWLPTAGLFLYLVTKTIGLLTVPAVLAGELFPTNIKAKAGAVLISYGSCMGFIFLKLFYTISHALGIYTMFWIFGGISILGSVFVIIVIPETKGKTFMEIQSMLNKQNEIDSSRL